MSINMAERSVRKYLENNNMNYISVSTTEGRDIIVGVSHIDYDSISDIKKEISEFCPVDKVKISGQEKYDTGVPAVSLLFILDV